MIQTRIERTGWPQVEQLIISRLLLELGRDRARTGIADVGCREDSVILLDEERGDGGGDTGATSLDLAEKTVEV